MFILSGALGQGGHPHLCAQDGPVSEGSGSRTAGNGSAALLTELAEPTICCGWRLCLCEGSASIAGSGAMSPSSPGGRASSFKFHISWLAPQKTMNGMQIMQIMKNAKMAADHEWHALTLLLLREEEEEEAEEKEEEEEELLIDREEEGKVRRYLAFFFSTATATMATMATDDGDDCGDGHDGDDSDDDEMTMAAMGMTAKRR